MLQLSSIQSWYKRLSYRSWSYKLSTLVVSVSFLIFLCFVMIPKSMDLYKSLASKTPLGKTQRQVIAITTDHIDEVDREKLKQSPQKVVMHQIAPKLELAGIGHEMTTYENQDVFTVGVLPTKADLILRKDSKMTLRVEAPSMTLLAQELFHSPRGQQLQCDMQVKQKQMLKEWTELLPEIQQSLQTHLQDLGQEKVKAILSDTTISNAIKNAVMQEIVEQVDLDHIGEKVAHAPALENLAQLAFKHYEVGKSLRLGGAQMILEMGTEGTEMKQHIASSWSQGTLPWDVISCTSKIGSKVFPMSQGLLSLLMSNAPSKLCKQIGQSIKNVAVGSGKAIGKDVVKQSVNSLVVEQEKSLKELQSLSSIAYEASEAPILLQSFWHRLVYDQKLNHYIKQTYGEDVWKRLQKSFLHIAQSKGVKKKIDQSVHTMKNVGKKLFTHLLLDQQGTGPNPLLLAVIQEQLRGESRPVIHVIPGQGAVVKVGHTFQSIETSLQSPQALDCSSQAK